MRLVGRFLGVWCCVALSCGTLHAEGNTEGRWEHLGDLSLPAMRATGRVSINLDSLRWRGTYYEIWERTVLELDVVRRLGTTTRPPPLSDRYTLWAVKCRKGTLAKVIEKGANAFPPRAEYLDFEKPVPETPGAVLVEIVCAEVKNLAVDTEPPPRAVAAKKPKRELPPASRLDLPPSFFEEDGRDDDEPEVEIRHVVRTPPPDPPVAQTTPPIAPAEALAVAKPALEEAPAAAPSVSDTPPVTTAESPPSASTAAEQAVTPGEQLADSERIVTVESTAPPEPVPEPAALPGPTVAVDAAALTTQPDPPAVTEPVPTIPDTPPARPQESIPPVAALLPVMPSPEVPEVPPVAVFGTVVPGVEPRLGEAAPVPEPMDPPGLAVTPTLETRVNVAAARSPAGRMVITEATTLRLIARKLYPSNSEQRVTFIRQMVAANPETFAAPGKAADQALAKGKKLNLSKPPVAATPSMAAIAAAPGSQTEAPAVPAADIALNSPPESALTGPEVPLVLPPLPAPEPAREEPVAPALPVVVIAADPVLPSPPAEKPAPVVETAPLLPAAALIEALSLPVTAPSAPTAVPRRPATSRR